MKKKIFPQLLKEFWIPFLIASCWTFYNLYSNSTKPTFLNILSSFSPAFFFLSWLLAQYWRVKKQIGVEAGFSTVEKNLINLSQELETKTTNLIKHITGGDSFFYYVVHKQITPDTYSLLCNFQGDFTLLGNRITFLTKDSNAKDHELNIPSINKELSSKASQYLKVKTGDGIIHLSVIIFNSNGKEWVQTIEFSRQGSKMNVHTVVLVTTTNERVEETYTVDFKPEEEWK
jgi:hypothetical protein